MAVDIRVGKVVRVEDFPRARNPSYKLWIDFGQLGVEKSSVQVTDLSTVDDLKDRLVLAVVHLPPRQIADFMSEVLVLGVPTQDGGKVALIGPGTGMRNRDSDCCEGLG